MTKDVLQALSIRLRFGSDAFLALGALALVAVLVAPLPASALDFLLALNLALSATILVVTLFARDALRFASFPTLLLFTTLFRLALNVSSTRLVLSRGDAGRVIEAFGRVVVQGNWVVGIVVFAILALVQLLVVAKGAERVAEVAARFTLDALPGKQMAIDADVRAGCLDHAAAQRRRRGLERESQLYGAMDGALKFVKGDAIASLAIVGVNVAGGIAAGLTRGMTLEVAVRRYVMLAIGDGLVSQVPALLVALAAGVAVTRVAAEDDQATLGGDVARQLFADPRPLGAVAALLAALSLAPGLPAMPFVVLAAACGVAAWRAAQTQPETSSAGGDEPSPQSTSLTETAPVRVELAEDVLASLRATARDPERDLEKQLLGTLWADRGVRLDGVAVKVAPLPPGTWRLVIDEVPALTSTFDPSSALSLAPIDDLELAAIDGQPATDPVTGGPATLVLLVDAQRAAALGPVRLPPERLAGSVAAALCANAHAIVGVQEVQALLDNLEPGAPALVREVTRLVAPATLAEVLRRLLEEQVSIRPLRTVLQAVLEAGGGARGAAVLSEACRRALRRHIANECAPGGALEALLLDPVAEARLRESLAGEVLAVSPVLLRELLASLETELGATPARSPVLLAGPDVRRPLRQLVSARFPSLAVLSWEELPPELPVRPLGRVIASA